MKAVPSHLAAKLNVHSRDPYRFEIYAAWIIISTLFIAIGLELFSWAIVVETVMTILALGTVGFYLHRFYQDHQKALKKEQLAKFQLINEISEQYPSLSPFKPTLEQMVNEQLATQSCSQKRLALLSYYRHNQAAMNQLMQQLRAREAQNRVLDELGLNWPSYSSGPSRSRAHSHTKPK